MLRDEYKLLIEENEIKPNRYVAKALLVCLTLSVSALILNELGIYLIDKVIMRVVSLASVVICLVPFFAVKKDKWASDPICKYVLIGFLFFQTFLALATMNFHVTLLIIFPLLMVTQYKSKRLFWVTFVSTLICVGGVTVFSYKMGMWDPNFLEMLYRFASKHDIVSTSQTVLEEGQIVKSIIIYLVLPKIFVVCVLGVIIYGIVKRGIENIENRIRIIHLNETDILTDLMNRNMYEVRMSEYTNICTKTVTCIFADVNGLHEINNEKGHEAGDIMLKFIANAIKSQFEREDVYRIGGDEYVAFAMDLPLEEIKKKVDEIVRDTVNEGYYVSIGFATIKKGEEMKELIAEAERLMYLEKKHYYETIGKNSRREERHNYQ